MEKGNLAGCRIIVTGASRGIGLALAVAAAKRGALVGANYRSVAIPQEPFADAWGNVTPLKFDVTDHAAIKTAFDAFCERHGGVDVVINNAGVCTTKLLIRQSVDDINHQVSVNLVGPIYVSQIACRLMARNSSGIMLHITSATSSRPQSGDSVYAAAKYGVEALSRGIAVEYAAKGIRSYCIRLGPVVSDMTNQLSDAARNQLRDSTLIGGLLTTENVATFILSTIASSSNCLTGTTIDYDGGFALANFKPI